VSDVNNATNPKPVGQAAQEIVEYYTKGMADQARDTRMETLGFKPKDRYPMMAKVGTVTAQPVDVFNRASVERFLVQQAVAAKAFSQYGQYMFAPGSMSTISVPPIE
jgi:hypothetical protein